VAAHRPFDGQARRACAEPHDFPPDPRQIAIKKLRHLSIKMTISVRAIAGGRELPHAEFCGSGRGAAYKDLAIKKLVAQAHAQSCEDGHDQRPLPFIHFDCTAAGAATMLTP
jgi:hypothetical protein